MKNPILALLAVISLSACTTTGMPTECEKMISLYKEAYEIKAINEEEGSPAEFEKLIKEEWKDTDNVTKEEREESNMTCRDMNYNLRQAIEKTKANK